MTICILEKNGGGMVMMPDAIVSGGLRYKGIRGHIGRLSRVGGEMLHHDSRTGVGARQLFVFQAEGIKE